MPPEDIGSSFYPELSPYSWRDPDVLESRMEQTAASAAGNSEMHYGLNAFAVQKHVWFLVSSEA